jgi:hypothetical protein
MKKSYSILCCRKQQSEHSLPRLYSIETNFNQVSHMTSFCCIVDGLEKTAYGRIKTSGYPNKSLDTFFTHFLDMLPYTFY